MSRNCLLVIAAAGYGKTTMLEADGLAWRAADLDADDLPPDRPLVIDDLHELAARGQQRLLAAVSPRVDLCIGSRAPLARAARAVLRGPVRERGPVDLALTVEQLAIVLRDEHGIDDVPLVLAVHDATAGWPTLVQLAADALRRGAGSFGPAPAVGLAEHLAEAGSPVSAWLSSQVLAVLPAAASAALGVAVQLDPVCVELLPEHADGLAWLRRMGLLVARPSLAPLVRAGAGMVKPDAHGSLAALVHPSLAPLVRAGAGMVQPEAHGSLASPRASRGSPLQVVPVLAAVLRRDGQLPTLDLASSARWYEHNGHPLAAATIRLRSGDVSAATALVETHGTQMIADGAAVEVAALDLRGSRAAQLVLGDALRTAGDPAAATRVFAALLRADGIDAALAWRAAMVRYMNGDYAGALAQCAGIPDGSTVDDVHLRAVRANALGTLGDAERASAAAQSAVDLAVELGDDGALATAHVAAANASTGGSRDTHLAQALAAAERIGDLVQLARVLVNQSDALMRNARFDQAAEVAARAVRAAQRGSPPGLLVTALCNSGEAMLRIGLLDAAEFSFERAIDICRRTGIGRMAMGPCGRAEVNRRRGRVEQAATAFDEAIELATSRGDAQVLVPALVRLTRLLLANSDVESARRRAEQAVAASSPATAPQALIATGWVALASGDLPTAGERADDAMRRAREARASDTLAEALELAAAATGDQADRRALLLQALALWDGAGARPSADRVRVLIGRAPGAAPVERAEARAAARRLVDLGVLTLDGVDLVPVEGAFAPVSIRVLGAFDVTVNGRPVPLPMWKSRQARTLIKILVARRGRPVARLELRELLWPDDDADRTAHRLSVLLSVVRCVLDPVKVWPTDHFVRADNAAVSLDLTHVGVDVEDFLRDAGHVLRPDAKPDRAALAELDTAYAGDAFPEEIYEDWAEGIRELVRGVRAQVLNGLATACRDEGALHEAASVLLRLLDMDQFDENIFQALVRTFVDSGRHGEARRVFERWTQAMRTIDAPAPNDSVLTPR